MQEAAEEALVRGPSPPATVTDTEVKATFYCTCTEFYCASTLDSCVTYRLYLQVVMMVGLPGSGKTSWAHKYCRDNLSKKYNILGADDIVQNIRVSFLFSMLYLLLL